MSLHGVGTRRSSSAAPTRSWVLPAVTTKAKGRPISSVSAWILLVRPPRGRPIAWQKVPLLRRRLSGGP